MDVERDFYWKKRKEWKKELHLHCEEAHTDQSGREVQEKKIEYFNQKGDQQFTMDGRQAEITVDLVLQAQAKVSDNKVSGPEDTVVSAPCGSDGCSQLVGDRVTGLPTKTGPESEVTDR